MKVSALVIDVYKGPALDAVSPLLLVRYCNIFENLFLLLLSAVEIFKLPLEPFLSHLGPVNVKFSRANLRPIDFGKEWVLLDLVCSLFACSETLARVSVEQMDDQILGFDGHAHWKLKDATLNVVE